jgi:hypothetical protein
LNCGNWSQITVMTAAARATALPIPSVYSIRKNTTEKNWNRVSYHQTWKLILIVSIERHKMWKIYVSFGLWYAKFSNI